MHGLRISTHAALATCPAGQAEEECGHGAVSTFLSQAKLPMLTDRDLEANRDMEHESGTDSSPIQQVSGHP